MSGISPWEDSEYSIGDDDMHSLFDTMEWQESQSVTQYQFPGSAGIFHGTPGSSSTPSTYRIPGPAGLFHGTPSSSSTPSTYRIPGPAGIVQDAKRRKAHAENPKETQEYIREILEHREEDPEFQRSPWLSAMEFAYPNGGNSDLGNMKANMVRGKLDKVVAVIKSCKPNVLGDLTVDLKDTTGEISGTIHHKAVVKGICVGCVLVIHKVSVFSPNKNAHYLNITKNNLVKVFFKDGGST